MAKSLLQMWPAPVIESVCEVLADTDQGFTNAEIDRLLAMVGIPDSVGPNKRTRLSKALDLQQQRTRSEISEHNGFANLLRGIFGTLRNPQRIRHEPHPSG